MSAILEERDMPLSESREKSEYRLRVASAIEFRVRAWALVHERMANRGCIVPREDGLWYGLHDALPETKTFLLSFQGRDCGAMTLAMDHPVPVPASAQYPRELDDLRRQGRRIVEVASLCFASDHTDQGMEGIRILLRAAIQTALQDMSGTDLILLAAPAHAEAYGRMFLFEPLGDIRLHARMGGAPVQALRLDLTKAEAIYREQYGVACGSLYHYFFIDGDALPWAESDLTPSFALSQEDVVEYFIKRRAILNRLPESLKHHVLGSCKHGSAQVPPVPNPQSLLAFG